MALRGKQIFSQPFIYNIAVVCLRINFSQLSIILTSSVFIVYSRRAHCVVIQVTGAFCGDSRRENERTAEQDCGWWWGGAKILPAGVSVLVKKPSSCTVPSHALPNIRSLYFGLKPINCLRRDSFHSKLHSLSYPILTYPFLPFPRIPSPALS